MKVRTNNGQLVYIFSDNNIISDFLVQRYNEINFILLPYGECNKENTNARIIIKDSAGGVDINEVYLTKPFRASKLTSIMNFYIEQIRSDNFEIGDYKFSPGLKLLTDGKETIYLTDKETSILYYLLHNGDYVPKQELLTQIWRYNNDVDTKTLETHLYKLRQKFPLTREILKVRGSSYKIELN